MISAVKLFLPNTKLRMILKVESYRSSFELNNYQPLKYSSANNALLKKKCEQKYERAKLFNILDARYQIADPQMCNIPIWLDILLKSSSKCCYIFLV